MLFHYKAISFNFQSIFSNFYNFLFSLSSFLPPNFSFLLFFADLFLIFFQRFFFTPSGLCFTFIIFTPLYGLDHVNMSFHMLILYFYHLNLVLWTFHFHKSVSLSHLLCYRLHQIMFPCHLLSQYMYHRSSQ